MRISTSAALLLSACSLMQGQLTASQVPQQYADCSDRVAAPSTPKEPRTLASIAQWANDLHDALHKANAARDDCAKKLSGLNSWIVQQGH